MRPLITVMLIFASANATAQVFCPADYTNTVVTDEYPWGIYQLQIPEYLYCYNCRDINAFTQDAINFAWNEVNYGNTTWPAPEPLLVDIEALAFEAMLNETYDSTPEVTLRVCNDHGQCLGVNILVNHNSVDTDVPYLPVPVPINTSVQNIVFTATRADGVQLQRVYSPQLVGQAEFPVPFDGDADTHPAEECLDNFGNVEVPDDAEFDSDIPDGGGGGGSDGGADLWAFYQDLHDQEEAYGGQVPHLRCGVATSPGAVTTRTCIWTYHD